VTVASRARRALDPGRLDPTLKSYQGFGFEFLTPRTAAAASAIPSKRFSHFGFRIHSSSTMLDEVIIIDDHPPPHQPYRIPRIISLDSDIIVIDSDENVPYSERQKVFTTVGSNYLELNKYYLEKTITTPVDYYCTIVVSLFLKRKQHFARLAGCLVPGCLVPGCLALLAQQNLRVLESFSES
jgi:hypothetical protein